MPNGDEAFNMIGTGIGLGIMAAGAMVPLIIMKHALDNNGNHTKSGIKISVPKMNMQFNTLPVKVNKIKIKRF